MNKENLLFGELANFIQCQKDKANEEKITFIKNMSEKIKKLIDDETTLIIQTIKNQPSDNSEEIIQKDDTIGDSLNSITLKSIANKKDESKDEKLGEHALYISNKIIELIKSKIDDGHTLEDFAAAGNFEYSYSVETALYGYFGTKRIMILDYICTTLKNYKGLDISFNRHQFECHYIEISWNKVCKNK